jgi:hypothetical protein
VDSIVVGGDLLEAGAISGIVEGVDLDDREFSTSFNCRQSDSMTLKRADRTNEEYSRCGSVARLAGAGIW